MKLANLIRGNDRGAISLRVLLSATLVAASAGLGALASMSAAAAVGSSGTVKVDDESLDGTDNNPHRACAIKINWDGFPVGTYTSTVTFTQQGGTGGGTLIASAPPSGGNTPAATETVTIATSGDSHTKIYSLTTTGLPLTPQGYHIKITVEVDGTAGNVYSKSKVIFAAVCDLAVGVAKTNNANGTLPYSDSEQAPAPDATVPFQVVIANPGNTDFVIDSITDEWPAQAAHNICATNVGVTLAPAASVTCTFDESSYAPAYGGSKVNTVRVGVHQASNAARTASGSDTTTVTSPAAPTLSGTVVKTSDADGDSIWTADETTPTAGAAVTFRATVRNTSGVTVDLGALSDTYGPGAGTTITPACSTTSPNVAKPATLAHNATWTCEFTVPAYTAVAGGSVSNVFSAVLSRTGSSSVTPTGSALVRTGPTLSGTVVKTSDADGDSIWTSDETAPTAGAAVTFRATVRNTSGVTVDLGALSDTYGPGAGTTITPACSTTSPNVAKPATLAHNATWTCEFTVPAYTAVPGGSVSNTFSATLSRAGSNSVTPTGSAVVRTAVVDLALTKIGPASRTTGQTGDYTLRVENQGTLPMRDPIVITDTLPTGVTVAGPIVTGGFTCTVALSVVTCTTPDDLAVGASKTITLPATFTTAGNMVNSATVAATGDVDLIDNTATAATLVSDPIIPPPPPPLPADLAVKKTGPASVTPGGTATWALTVTNKGPGNASGFSVTDTLPAGVSLTSLSGAGFTCTTSTVVCTFTGVLLPTQTAVVTVVGAVGSAITGTSIANVVVVGPTDATPADNTDTLVSLIDRPAAPADLVLEKTGPAVVVAGEQITWTITVTNAGGQGVTGFTVGDPLADGVSLVGGSGDGWFCTTNLPLSCVFPGTLAPGETATLAVTGLLDADSTATSVTNTATVPLQGDLTPENNTDSVTVPVAVPIEGGEEEPATGSPSPSPSPLPDLPFVPEEERPDALPFTGSSTDQLLGAGALLSVLGLLLIVTGRRRRAIG